MSGKTGQPPSRPTNQNNSVTQTETTESANSQTALADPGVEVGQLLDLHDREIPTPAERVAEFYREYPERSNIPLTQSHGTQLRRDYCHEEYRDWSSEAMTDQEDGVSGSQLVERSPFSWGHAVQELLESHEDTRHTTLNLERGRPTDPTHEEFSIPAQTRWSADYQKRYFARMKGWLRELLGGERPSGGVTEPTFDDPHVVLITRSASSTPDGERVGFIDHENVMADSWQPTYHELRNVMRRLGIDWQYDRRAEPHTGKQGAGINRCYTHEHIVMVVDGEVTPSDIRPVVEKHVEKCEWAGPDAHDLDVDDWDANADDVGTVEIRDPSELEDVAAYVADYTSIEPTDLLDRSIEFVAWAAGVTAANTKTISRSDAANHAAAADACKQQFESDHADQSVDHGESVIRASSGCRHDLECAKCGSPHGIDQEQTLTTARLNDSDSTQAVADGGLDHDGQRKNDLRERWPSAKSAAAIGETASRTQKRKEVRRYVKRNSDASPQAVIGALNLPPDDADLVREVLVGYQPDEAIGFNTPPEWTLKSVTIHDQEYPASAGNGVEMVSTVRPVQNILKNTFLGADGAETTNFRYIRSNVSLRGGERMAQWLVHKQEVRDPHHVERVVKPCEFEDFSI